MNWETFFSAFGGTTVALAALGSLFTFIIQHRLNLRLASFNGDLQKDLAKVSAELSVVTKRQEIAFSALHAKRATVIEELYVKLLALYVEAGRLKGWHNAHRYGAEYSQEKVQEAVQPIDALWRETHVYYKTHAIYFGEPLNSQILTLIGKASYASDVIANGIYNDKSETNREIQKVIASTEKVLGEVIKEFKDILGVVDKPNSTP